MSSPLRRTNGRLQACDQCRTRKIACDHARPVCGRCQKRKTRKPCTYTLSAKTVDPSTTRQQDVPPTPASAGRIHDSDSPPNQHTHDQAPFSSRLESADVAPVIGRSSQSIQQPTPSQHRTFLAHGYQGYTSLATVIDETLPLLHQNTSEGDSSIMSEEPSPQLLTQRDMVTAVRVLEEIPSPQDAIDLFSIECVLSDSWIQMIAQCIVPTVYAAWGDHLGHDGGPRRYEEMIERISKNTMKPLEKLRDPYEWLQQFSGENLRWESLGLLFVFWTRPEKHRSDADTFRSRAGYPSRSVTLETVSVCLDLALQFTPGNLWAVYLSLKVTTWESLRSGDASLATWRKLANTVAILTFTGLHAESADDNLEPTLHAEANKRMLALVYDMDKISIAFTGRPPLLSTRCITTPIPVDVHDRDLLLSPEALADKIRTGHDENGWNTAGHLYSSTALRARYARARIKEKIAEAALGKASDVSAEDLCRIQQEHRALKASLPPQLIFRVRDLADPHEQPRDIFTRLLTTVELHQNDFFLHRLLIQRGQPDDEALTNVSFEMVTLILHLWTNKDIFQQMKKDFEWLLIGYGASPGGHLCKCLLQAQANDTPILSSNPAITRSSIIQKLSLLVGFLDWVRPSAPNAEMCRDAKSVIRRVLDQVLDPTAVATPSYPDDPPWSAPMQLDFNFDLMDTFDWLRTDLANGI